MQTKSLRSASALTLQVIRSAKMIENPKLSVVIPCYNAERWIKSAIESAFQSTSESIEVIVVNDGSNDRTSEIIQEFGQAIVVIEQENTGVVQARKNGVKKAKGEYIKFLDADDLLPTDSLTSVLSETRRFPGDVLVGRALEFSDSEGLYSEKMYKIGQHSGHLSYLQKEFLLTQATHSGLWLIPRFIFEKNNLFPIENILLGEEYLFCMRMIETGVPIRYIDEVVYFVRTHDSKSRLSRSADENRHLLQAGLIEESVNFIYKKIPTYSPEALKQIANLCWARGRECIRMGYREAARSYFEVSKKADPLILPSGRPFYRYLCRFLGPVYSEILLENFKRIIPSDCIK